jgi:hypothetical protein
VYTLAQEQYKAADARDTEVAAIATSMRARTVDQQLAVAWPETRDTSRVALVGWGNDGQPVLLDAFASTWAYFTDPICRLAAADILHLGADQLVYANSADWGGGTNCDYYPEYAHYYHCAALTLFTLDESVPSAPKLKCESKYVLGDMKRAENPYYDFTLKPSKDYYEYVDLHIAAGVFGTCMGVQVIGLRGLEGGGFAPTCGFIPVDPASRSFPAMPGEIPIPPKPWYPPSSGDVLPQPPQFYRSTPSPNWCAGAGDRGQFLPAATDVNRILAFPTSLNGESIVLGAPEVKSLSKCGQILAIIQAHPFHGKVANSTPSVGFSTTTNESKGLSISTDKSWTLSDDTSVNLGLGGLSLSQATHNSFLRNLTHSADSSYSNSVHLQTGITHEDHLLVSEINYNVWRYPVLRYSGKNKPGEMLVVFPLDARPHTAWISARKYGYRPRWEVGMLFSYINVPKDGYAPENELCSLTEYEVGQNLDTSSQSFDLTESDSNSEGRHLGIQQGVSQHAGLTASTELFDCLPVSFGFNIGTSHSYSTNKIETTHLNVHKGLSLSVNSGSVKKDMYSYTVRPVVYRHSRLGCLVLAWDVSVGDGWDYADASFRLSEVVLIRPTSSTDSPVYDALSRSLSFVEQNDRITGVTAEIFVNGRTSIRDKVFCEFFDVTSKFASGPPADLAQLTKPEHSLGKVQANDGELKPLERRVVTLSGLNLPKPAWVAVRLFIDEMAGGVYWNVHPPERFFHS